MIEVERLRILRAEVKEIEVNMSLLECLNEFEIERTETDKSN
jgi:hypothetical protein